MTIATPRWHASWSDRLMLGRARIVRLDNPPINPLRQLGYLQSLRQFLRSCQGDFDVLYCDHADLDAETAMACFAGRSARTVVRLDTEAMEPTQQDTALAVCSKASAVLIPSQAVHRWAIASGLASESLFRINDWLVPGVERAEFARRQARQILGEANPELRLHRRDRLVVVPAEMNPRWRIDFLIHAIAALIEQQPGLRLWITGGDAGWEGIYDLLRDYGIHRDVVLAGIFTSVDALLQAADLCLFPGSGCGLGFLLPTCVASGIPVLAAENSELEVLLGPSTSKLSFPTEDAQGLSRAVANWWQTPKSWEDESRQAQRFLRGKMVRVQPSGVFAFHLLDQLDAYRSGASDPFESARSIGSSGSRMAQ